MKRNNIEQILKSLENLTDAGILLDECIDCHRKCLSGDMSIEDESFYETACDMCSDQRKNMCELFQRFTMAVSQYPTHRGHNDKRAYTAFIKAFIKLTHPFFD